MRIDFGKHAGEDLEDIPSSYLGWVLKNVTDLNPWLRRGIEAELNRRVGEHAGPSTRQASGNVIALVDLRGIIGRWFSDLSRRHHPDRGGNHERMLALNDAHEELKRCLGI